MFKEGDIVICIGTKIILDDYQFFDTSKWHRPGNDSLKLFQPYKIISIFEDLPKFYLHLNDPNILELGFDSDGFILLKEYRKQKLEKLCLR